ncbi:hypothetical protein ATN83_3948 [Raoultella ornithinolytica]|uniref:hypothetical protein n=1 Tax=Raoultella ornithinolytica TaxID=54291 RepID=UPI000722FAB1|nr:hypothetical protein [Raoultella ornithinolytica]ALQ48057.1 hypothetical protein ATN83_3948 [Raoultella ornithinolytica]
MAEVPLPTPTQVPVPSTDIRNAVFAGAKLDEEVTGAGEFYTDRLGVKRLTNTGRNNQFDAAQLDRANRFEQFLLSSGYVFLGDYEDGPFQFSARNQYIRYNNQYYRLNATTDVGFTTTGTDATSFANDVTHFVLMDGDTLRQSLGSGEEGAGASIVATTDGENVQMKVNKSEIGTDALRDSVESGVLDVLLSSTVAGTVALALKKFVIPTGVFSAKRWLRNRGISADDGALEDFSIRGQDARATVLKMPTTGVGDHIFADYIKRGYIGKFTVDNSDLTPGTNQATSKNGQLWIRYAEDSQFDDIVFRGGDVFSYALGTCKNILSTNLKVDFQYRYPVGYSKSPLIVGDFSEKCMFIGGYVRSVSPDGSVVYSGDLADNDQANDTKWAFINLLGLPYATKASANACMWQEGEDAASNSHFFGLNYYGNGIGHGISQAAVGTDIGCTFRENQVRSVWNSGARYFSVGNHYIDNKGLNPAGVSSSSALGAIHNDGGRFLASVGDYFSGNLRDLADVTGSTVTNYRNSIHLQANRHDGAISLPSAGTAIHLGVDNCQLTENAAIYAQNDRVHSAIVSTHSIGYFGTFGNGASKTIADVIACTMIADTYAGAMVTQNALGAVNFERCVIRGYASLISATNATLVTFKSCTFVGCTFTATDLNAKYVNCEFIDCTNAPNTVGRNFAADSLIRPSSARCEVTVGAGGTYTFPSWVAEARGIYTIRAGGRGADAPYAEIRIAKANATSSVAGTVIVESTAGNITAAWASNSQPTITFAVAGTYTIKLG